MVMDLESLTQADLQALKKDVEQEIYRRETEEKNKAKKQIIELAKAYGLNVKDVLAKTTTSERGPVAPKYRNPDDATQTWTGRGRKPVWVQKYLNEGFSLHDLEI